MIRKKCFLPIFRFSKAFSLAWDAKAFLSVQGGITRGAVPDVERHNTQASQSNKQAEKLRNARQLIKEQSKTLRNKDREIFQLKNELRAMKAGESQIGALPDFVIIGAQKCGTT